MTAAPRPHEGRPTRGAILALLDQAPGGMTAAELAAALGVHPNAVRKHLPALAAAGAVGARREATGRRGRPATRWRSAGPRHEQAAVRRLARMLVELVGEIGGADEGRLEEFGARQAGGLGGAPDGRAALLDVLTDMGFAPRETTAASDARAGRAEVVLDHCPFADAVEAGEGRLVCALHRGISRGLVERTPGARLTGFEARPPVAAGCRIAAEGLAAASP
jgi:predicted ArsR family transcriptional regulator